MAENDRAEFETCQIVFWRGYVKCAFYAVSEGGEPVGSPFFRSREPSPEQSGSALEAHRELVERLEDEGWEAFARGRDWYALSFRRRGWSPLEAFSAEPLPKELSAVEAHAAAAAAAPAAAAPPPLPPPEPEPEEAPSQEQAPLPRAAAHRSRRQLALLVVAAAWIALAIVLGLTVFDTNSAQGKPRTPAGPAKLRHERRVVPASHPAKLAPTTIVVRGSHGSSWVEARVGSAKGKSLYAGTVARGQTVRVSAPVVWVTFGAAENLALRVNGRSPVPGTFKGTITAVIAHGRVRSS